MMEHAPEEFFRKHGTTETYSPIDSALDDLPPIDAYKEDEIEPDNVRLDYGRRRERAGDRDRPQPPIAPKLVFPTSLRGLPVPEMEWIIDGWIPIGDVTLLYGDGGVGKTLLAQELMASTAIGAPWCTLPARHCKSLGVFCEDDDNELHRRQDGIQRFLGTDFHDDRMDDMAWWCRKGEDNLLCTFDFDGVIQLTPFYYAILDAAKNMGARLVILDTAADLFGGNENDRGQVRQFIGALSRLAMAINGAVVLNAHPSKTGMATGGSMDSGSTGWSNSARSRLALERMKAEGDEKVDTDERILTKKKANRSSIGEVIKLRWRDGVIASACGEMGIGVIAERADADATFLSLLARCGDQGFYVSASNNAGNFAPKVFGKRPDRDGFASRHFEAAMHRLFAGNVIRVEDYRALNRLMRQRIGLV